MDLVGKITPFKVLRETDIAYTIKSTNDLYDEEFFLHKNDCAGRMLKKNDIVDCYLFFDNKHRLAASLVPPKILVGEIKNLAVVSINYELGVFLDNGISKELLLSKDYLPFNKKYWPLENSFLPVKLKVAKNALKAVLNKEMFSPYKGKIGEELVAKVVLYSKDDLILLTDDFKKIKVLKNNYFTKHKVGEMVNVVITYLGFSDTLGKIGKKDIESIKLLKGQMIRSFKLHDMIDYYTPEKIKVLFKLTKNQFKKYVKELITDEVIEIKAKKILLKGTI